MAKEPDFKVTGQQGMSVVTPSGDVQDVYRVSFHDNVSDSDGYVDVPKASYSADVVLTLIADVIRQMRGVHALDTLP